MSCLFCFYLLDVDDLMLFPFDNTNSKSITLLVKYLFKYCMTIFND